MPSAAALLFADFTASSAARAGRGRVRSAGLTYSCGPALDRPAFVAHTLPRPRSRATGPVAHALSNQRPNNACRACPSTPDLKEIQMSIDDRNSDYRPRRRGFCGGDRHRPERARYRGPIPEPRRPGPREHRRRRALERLRAIVRADRPDWSEAEVRDEAKRQLNDLLNYGHPLALDEYLKLAPTSRAPNRLNIDEVIEAAAIRRMPEISELEELLGQCHAGRPSERRLALAVFEAMFLLPGRCVVKHVYQQFMGADAKLDWAFGHPANGDNYRGRSSVASTLNAMLDRNDPDFCLELTVRSFRRLAKLDGDRGLGQIGVADGTAFPAPREQAPDFSPGEEALLNDGLTVDLGYDEVRGTTLLPLWDMKSGLPMSWVEFPRSEREHTWLTAAVDNLLVDWPDAPLEVIVGDRAYDDEMLARDLIFRYGIQPVAAIKGKLAQTLPHVESAGVPVCAKHGPMKLERAPGFFTASGRLQHGVRIGELTSEQTAARLVWRCHDPLCPVRTTTYPRRSARLYTYYPRQGGHRRAATRIALGLRRSIAECGFDNLKHRGLAGRGVEVARWLNTDTRRRWLQGAYILAMNLRRLAHETGEYEHALAEAIKLGLIKQRPKGGE